MEEFRGVEDTQERSSGLGGGVVGSHSHPGRAASERFRFIPLPSQGGNPGTGEDALGEAGQGTEDAGRIGDILSTAGDAERIGDIRALSVNVVSVNSLDNEMVASRSTS